MMASKIASTAMQIKIKTSGMMPKNPITDPEIIAGIIEISSLMAVGE